MVIDGTDPNDLRIEFGGRLFHDKTEADNARGELVEDPDFKESAHLFEVAAVHWID